MVLLKYLRWFDEINIPTLLALLSLAKPFHSLGRMTMRLLRLSAQKQKPCLILVYVFRQTTLTPPQLIT